MRLPIMLADYFLPNAPLFPVPSCIPVSLVSAHVSYSPSLLVLIILVVEFVFVYC